MITSICKVLLIIGLVCSIVGGIVLLALPGTTAKFINVGMMTVEVDYAALGQTVPEDQRELLEQIGSSEEEWRIETVRSGALNGNLKFAVSGKSYAPTEVNVNDTGIEIQMISEESSFTLKNVGVMLLVVMVELIVTLITVFLVGALCKAFRDCQSPFEENVINKMQKVAISLIPWTVVSSIVQSVLTGLMTGNTEFSLVVDMGVVLVVLIVLILVYIFKYGAVLQQESDETL